jgi:hemerythrin
VLEARMAQAVANGTECAGIELLESDHLKMMALAHKLCERVRLVDAPREIADLMDNLAAHTREHFACEEMLMDRIGYACVEEQRHEHENMTAWIEEMRTRFWEGTLPVPTLEAVEYLRDWILEHVVHSDQRCFAEAAAH